jgi:hypothetical protein
MGKKSLSSRFPSIAYPYFNFVSGSRIVGLLMTKKRKYVKHRFSKKKKKIGIVADPGCLSWIPDPSFFHPGSASKNLSFLTQKNGF